ncbi:hypothetical protein LZQ00_03815 [Sphingobacterium sp. SRCM116780]|uniref:hypothetical protein n=1 Tax=Sphingobacterium sp. SRCM116780 TaxID=2907623 RepID=UPI001F173495|nr:hypothetical protein [Sphingobacterium sp. SRCM116780]UIR56948.1 hypothetical protein LZQ00_03815 [Sphingobacterium sp. SRCM116780]
MSNQLNFNRLFALIRRQWITIGRIYLMALVIIGGIFLAFYGDNLRQYYNEISTNPQAGTEVLEFRPMLFKILGLFFVTIISSSYFSDLGQKAKAIFELMIPASRLEKFLAAIFYTVIVSLGSYLLLFFLIDYAFVSHLRSIGSSITTKTLYNGDQSVVDNWTYFFKIERQRFVAYFYFLPFLLNGIFLLGSISFKNFQYIKTAISMIVYVGVWVVTLVSVMKVITDNTINVTNDGYFQNQEHVFQLMMIIGIVLTFIFWGLAFLRLKEKEV